MITSSANPTIKEARRLATRNGRYAAGQVFVEGVRLATDIWRSGAVPEQVFYAPDLLLSPEGKQLLAELKAAGCRCLACTAAVFASLSEPTTPQGIGAIWPLPQLPWPAQPSLLLILDGVSDPGNAGTLVRSAEAAGCDGVLFAPGTVDPFNEKTLRAGMSAQFRLPTRVCTSWSDVEPLLPPTLHCFVADAHAQRAYTAVDWRPPAALVVCNEAHGASSEASRRCTPVTIPMLGAGESLNAAIAGAVILFEAARQRRPDFHNSK